MIERCDIQAAEAANYSREIILLLDADWAMPSFDTLEQFKKYCHEWHGDRISDAAIVAIYQAAEIADPTQP